MARILLNPSGYLGDNRNEFSEMLKQEKEIRVSPLAPNNQKDKIAKHLCQFLESGDEVDRCGISKVLGKIKAVGATAALITCLRDDNIDVCVDAAEALGRIGEPHGIAALTETLLEDPSSEVKCAATDALKGHGTPEVIAAMLEVLLQSPEQMDSDESDRNFGWDLQLKLTEALGELRATEALPCLTHLLEDDFEDAEAIETEILRALSKLGDQGENIILKRLKQGTPRQKRRAAQTLPLCHSSRSWDALVNAIHDKEVRSSVVEALCSYLDADKFLELFLELLKDPAVQVRSSVLKAILRLKIGKTMRIKFVDAVAVLLHDIDSQVRILALNTLTQLTERLQHLNIERALLVNLLDQDPYVSIAACELIENCRYSPAIPILQKLIQQSDQESAALPQAIRTLGGLLDPAGEEWTLFIPLLELDQQTVCLATLNVLIDLDKRSDSKLAADDQQISAADSPMATLLQGLNGELIATAKSETDEEIATSSPPIESAMESPEKNSLAAATSTIEAILLDNDETKAKLSADTLTSSDSNPPQETFDGSLSDYNTIVDNNSWQRQGSRNPLAKPAVNIRYLCARVLGNSDRSEVLTMLMANAHSEDVQLCKECLSSIAVILERNTYLSPPAGLFELLICKVEDSDLETKLNAIRCLGLLGDELVITPLIQKLNHSDPAVCVQAIRALSILLKIKPYGTGEPHPINDQRGESALIYQAIYSLLGDSRSIVRRTATEALSHLNSTDATDGIIAAAALDDGSQARILGQSIRKLAGDNDISAPLIRALDGCVNSAERHVFVAMIEEIYTNTTDTPT
ncbi:HEAT repeat domain-containing protein [Pseudomonadota bacterium]